MLWKIARQGIYSSATAATLSSGFELFKSYAYSVPTGPARALPAAASSCLGIALALLSRIGENPNRWACSLPLLAQGAFATYFGSRLVRALPLSTPVLPFFSKWSQLTEMAVYATIGYAACHFGCAERKKSSEQAPAHTQLASAASKLFRGFSCSLLFMHTYDLLHSRVHKTSFRFSAEPWLVSVALFAAKLITPEQEETQRTNYYSICQLAAAISLTQVITDLAHKPLPLQQAAIYSTIGYLGITIEK